MTKTSEKRFLLAVQLLNSGTEVIVFDKEGDIKGRAYNANSIQYPEDGRVEIAPNDIWRVAVNTINEALSKGGIYHDEVGAIGIANQKNTVVVWDKKTGEPLCNAVGAACPRAQNIAGELIRKRMEKEVKNRTGLNISHEYAGPKLKWLLDNVDGLRKSAIKGDVAFGSVDSWILWKLTGGKAHYTDYTNASWSMLFNIKALKWDKYLLQKLNIPAGILPQVKPSGSIFGCTEKYGNIIDGIPVGAIAAIEQASMLGLGCASKGMVKNTYEESSSFMMSVGAGARITKNSLQTVLSCTTDKSPMYAIEGTLMFSSVSVRWIRDNLKLIESVSETEEICDRANGVKGVYMVPSFERAQNLYSVRPFNGAILGLNGSITKEHLVKAALESLSFQTMDILELMEKGAGLKIKEIMGDGSLSKNNYLMQFLADILGVKTNVFTTLESAPLGAGFLAGLSVKYFKKIEDIRKLVKVDNVFAPKLSSGEKKLLLAGWKKALKHVIAYGESK